MLKRLEEDRNLESVSHIVIDEVHERSLDSDFLLIIVKKLIKMRKDVKVILMSASIDAEKFAMYFNNAPIIQVEGRTFPVKEFFLEDVIETTKYVCEQDSEYMKKMDRNIDGVWVVLMLLRY